MNPSCWDAFPVFSDCAQHTTSTAHLQHECLSLCNLSEWCTEYIQLIDSNTASQQPQTCSIEGGQVYGQCCSPVELVPLTYSKVQAVKETIGPTAQHMGNSIPPERHKAKHRSSRKPKTKLYSHVDLSQWQCQQLRVSPVVHMPKTTPQVVIKVDFWGLLEEDSADVRIVSSPWSPKKIGKELFYLKTTWKVCLLSTHFYLRKLTRYDVKHEVFMFKMAKGYI